MPIVGRNGRSPLQLICCSLEFVTGPSIGAEVHGQGARDRAFNYTLDGFDNNEASQGGGTSPARLATGWCTQRPPVPAIGDTCEEDATALPELPTRPSTRPATCSPGKTIGTYNIFNNDPRDSALTQC